MSNNKKSSTKINVTNKFAVLDLHLDDRRYLHQIDLIFIQEKLRINN